MVLRLLDLGERDFALALHRLRDLLLDFPQCCERLTTYRLNRTLQGRVNGTDGLLQVTHTTADRAPKLSDGSLYVFRNSLACKLTRDFVEWALKRFDLDVELFEDLSDLRLDRGDSESRPDHGHFDPVRLEVGTQLSEIRHLTGSPNVRHRREDMAFDHRPEQHIRA